MERGFKAWCERYSASKREQLGVPASAPLDARLLAKNLEIAVCTPHDVPGLSEKALTILLQNDRVTPSCWSAVTIIEGSKTLVILNSSHPLGRQSSDLMHELAHRIREHETHQADITPGGLMLLSGYDKEQEDEADWLSATLLLPRDALTFIKRRKLEPTEAAQEYGVSPKMLKYRMAMTGVEKQFSARAR